MVLDLVKVEAHHLKKAILSCHESIERDSIRNIALTSMWKLNIQKHLLEIIYTQWRARKKTFIFQGANPNKAEMKPM